MRKILVTWIWCLTKNSHNPNIKCDSDCFLCPASDTCVSMGLLFSNLPLSATTWYRMFSVLLLSFCLSAYYLCLFQLILQTYLCNYVIITFTSSIRNNNYRSFPTQVGKLLRSLWEFLTGFPKWKNHHPKKR